MRLKALAVSVALIIAFSGLANASGMTEAQIPALVQTIIMAESSGNTNAVGDGGAARGLCQIQKATWQRYTSEPWEKAFTPEVNKNVCAAILRDIIRTYRARGVEPSAAYVIWTYNTGSYIKHYLPKTDKHGRPHPWTVNHPNRIYRQVYRDFFNKGVTR